MWEEKGGKVIYTLYENLERSPPGKADLIAFENHANKPAEELPFRVLNDAGAIIPTNFRNVEDVAASLPFMVVLDRHMQVADRGHRAHKDRIYGVMRRLMDEP